MAVSVGQAVGEGFGILGRRPLALVGWAMAYLVFTVLIVALVGGAVLGAVLPIMRGVATGTPPDPSAVMAMVSGMAGAILLILPVGLVFNSMLVGAVFRAVLEPDKQGFAYLRLGSQELWLALVFFVEAILFFVLYFAAAIVIGILAAIGGRAVGGLLVFLGIITAFIGFLYLAVRFSLAGPATFAERRFALFESWNLTNGNTGALFLTGLLIVLICIGVWIAQFILSLITNLAGFGLGAMPLAGQDPEALKQALGDPLSLFARLGPMFVVQLIVGAIFSSIYLAIANAPWAGAYRQIKGSDTPAVFS